MRRWAGRWSHFRWLLPGMGVKRWLLLLLAGLPFVGLANVLLANLVAYGTAPAPFTGNVTADVLIDSAVGLTLVVLAVFGYSRSLLSSFRKAGQGEVVDVVYRHRQRKRGPKVVALGGGHGLNTLLRGLKEYTDNITAIVTVADDGGSSGRLRRDLGMLPPGDFRNCIAALSDAEGLMTQLLQYRFGEDTDLGGHSFGNLYLMAMAAITGSFESALSESSRVLAVRGRVVPSSLAQVVLCADIIAPTGSASPTVRVCGESQIPAAGGRIRRVFLQPDRVPAYPEAIRAVLEADLIIAGPGSLYTSVLPNLLVRDLAEAVASSKAPKVYVCNVATQPGETDEYDVTRHIQVIGEHLAEQLGERRGRHVFGTVLANRPLQPQTVTPGGGAEWVSIPIEAPSEYRLICLDLVDGQYPWRHDPHKLAEALMEFIDS
jgi:uncharacterized cofD-like protein